MFDKKKTAPDQKKPVPRKSQFPDVRTIQYSDLRQIPALG